MSKLKNRPREGRKYNLHIQQPKIEESTVPPQAKVILRALCETRKRSLTEGEVFEVCGTLAERLKTKQDPILIFRYYRKRLVEDGWLTVEDAPKQDRKTAESKSEAA